MSTPKIHKLWDWMPMAGITFFNHVFVKRLDDKLTIEHELVHVRQQTEHPIWFWFSYLFFPLPIFWSWRYKWEAEAYAVEAKAGCPIEGEHGLAKTVSGSLYWWPCRYSTAVKAITEWANK